MGWEFRVFSPLESANALVDPSKQTECRSDTYIVVSDRVGLKYRHGSQLEVKTKRKISKCSKEIEKWKKHEGQTIDSVKDLLKKLKIYGEEEKEALAKMTIFKTDKRRETWTAMNGSVNCQLFVYKKSCPKFFTVILRAPSE